MASRQEERLVSHVAERVTQALESKSALLDKPEDKGRTWNRVAQFWGSTPVWGIIGLLIGAIASQISRQLVFIGVGFGLFLEFIRVGFFRGRLGKALGNAVAGAVIAALLVVVWRVVPQPKDTPTMDQQLEGFAKRFPWLANPPKQGALQAQRPPLPTPETTEMSFAPIVLI